MHVSPLPTAPRYEDRSGAAQPGAPAPTSSRFRYAGLLAIAMGAAGWWYNWHLASTEGHFYIKLCLFGPLGILGGLLILVRPEWAGPLHKESSRAHKTTLGVLIALMMVLSGIDMYLLNNSRPSKPSLATLPRNLGIIAKSSAPEIPFLGRMYRLGSFNQKFNPTWEFVTANETVENWKTLLTIVDRPDARTVEEMDRLAAGLMSAYKSNGGQILAAKTMRDDSGAAFNYMVAAFDQPASRQFELNFVKIAMGAQNAVVMIYGVRVNDARDYKAAAKAFLNTNAQEIGRALGSAPRPDTSKLPRRTF